MTENTPDAVEEIASIIRYYSNKPYTVEASRNAAAAILGARAMQAAMPAPDPSGWIVGNADGDKWRRWDEAGIPIWTRDRNEATRYARRKDAEDVHREDEDVWRVVPSAIAREGTAPALNLHDAYARERAEKNSGTGHSQKVAVIGHLDRGKTTLATAVALVMDGRATPAGAGDLVEQLRDASDDPYFQMTPGVEAWLKKNWALREAAASRIEALEAENAALRIDHGRLQTKAMGAVDVANAAEADLAALRAEVERLRQTEKSCQWYWPYGATESENCADCPSEVVQSAYGWEAPTGAVVAVARGGVVDVTYCAALPAADDADSDDEFWVEEASAVAAAEKIATELKRRAALAPAKAGG